MQPGTQAAQTGNKGVPFLHDFVDAQVALGKPVCRQFVAVSGNAAGGEVGEYVRGTERNHQHLEAGEFGMEGCYEGVDGFGSFLGRRARERGGVVHTVPHPLTLDHFLRGVDATVDGGAERSGYRSGIVERPERIDAHAEQPVGHSCPEIVGETGADGPYSLAMGNVPG